MNEMTTRWKIPGEKQKLNGTIVARVTGYEMTESKIDHAPQIAFHFTGRQGGKITLYMTVTSKMLVNKYMEAGVIRAVGMGEFEVTPIALQPWLRVTLKDDRLVAFSPPEEWEAG